MRLLLECIRKGFQPNSSILWEIQRWQRESGVVVDVFQESKGSEYTGKWKVDISIVGHYQEDELPSTPIIHDDYDTALLWGLIEGMNYIKS